MSNVLTVVFDKVEQKLDPVIAAAVNELHNLGHIVKEVRVMSDSGEVKVALNTVEGIVGAVAAATPIAPPAPTEPTPTPTSVAEVEGAPVDTPSIPQAPVLGAAPTSTPVGSPTIDQQREALLAQLEELDKEEAASVPPTAPA